MCNAPWLKISLLTISLSVYGGQEVALANDARILHKACVGDDVGSAIMLLTRNPQLINVQMGNFNTSPLDSAAIHDAIGVATVLIMHNADVNEKNSSDQTPLHTAAVCGSAKMVPLLIASRATIDAQNCNDRTPLLSALNNGFKRWNSNYSTIVHLLIAGTANVNYRDLYDGNTALHVAAYNNAVDVVQRLLRKNADICIVNKCGHTPFDIMFTNKHKKPDIAIAKLFIAAGYLSLPMNIKKSLGTLKNHQRCSNALKRRIRTLGLTANDFLYHRARLDVMKRCKKIYPSMAIHVGNALPAEFPSPLQKLILDYSVSGHVLVDLLDEVYEK